MINDYNDSKIVTQFVLRIDTCQRVWLIYAEFHG